MLFRRDQQQYFNYPLTFSAYQIGSERAAINVITINRVGGCPLIEQPTSHTTVRTVRYTAVQ